MKGYFEFRDYSQYPHLSLLSPVLSAALFSIWLLFLTNYLDHQHGSSEVMILHPSGLLVSHYERVCVCAWARECVWFAPNGSSPLSALAWQETLHKNVCCSHLPERLWLMVFPWALCTCWIFPFQSATKQDLVYRTLLKWVPFNWLLFCSS